jgi:hypothetical protein
LARFHSAEREHELFHAGPKNQARARLRSAGVAGLADKTANPTGADYDETLHCYFETWMQGTDFVGPSAASDKTFVAKIANALRENYPNRKADKFVYVDL